MLITLERVLDPATVLALRQALQADDAPWQDGARSAGALAAAVKHNQQLDDASALAARLRAQVLAALQAQPLFTSAALPRRIHPPKFNRYAGGGHYGAHVDSAVMRWPGPGGGDAGWLRTDLSATLFLAEPEDYEGGELEVETPFGVQAVKLAAGDLVLYPATSLHRVTPVTRGARLACFLWIESLVRDEGERALLFDLDRAIQGLSAGRPADDPHLLALSGTYHNLLRRWAQT